MEVARRRTATRKGVVAGSVWESRMKMDEVKGGIKVFNGEENSEEGGSGELQVYRRLKQNQKGGVRRKRKTWKSESVDEPEKTPILTRSESLRVSDESCKELNVSVDGIEKNPIQIMKTKSESIRVSDESCKELGVSVDGIEKNPNQIMKTKSESIRVSDESCKELGVSVDGIERNPIQIRIPDEACKEIGVSVDEIERNPIEIRKGRSDSLRIPDDACKELEVSVDGIERNPIETRFDSRRLVIFDDGDEEEDEDIDKKSFDVKEINIPEQKPKQILNEEKKLHQIPEKPIPSSANVNEEKKLHQIHEKPIPISANVNEEKKHNQIPEKPIPISVNVNKEKKLHRISEKSTSIFANVNRKPRSATGIAKKKPPAVIDHPLINPNLRNPPPISVSGEFGRIPVTQNNLQNIVDLVMWRNVSKSAFVFGLGTFILLSSSYTKDLNFSLISAISYLGLLYLGAIFLYKSIICRGAIDLDDSREIYMVGEEEAIWFLKLILPYLNEFLLRIRGLFSGDPGTTMKLAVLLFVLARCGSSITIWKMAKLGFFGVFTVPKVCSSYSTQLTVYGKFWVRRFRDAWDSCSHKKAAAFTIFTLVWNLSSIVARIWAVFMLVVAVRYYQQTLISEDWEEEEGERGQRQERGPL